MNITARHIEARAVGAWHQGAADDRRSARRMGILLRRTPAATSRRIEAVLFEKIGSVEYVNIHAPLTPFSVEYPSSVEYQKPLYYGQ